MSRIERLLADRDTRYEPRRAEPFHEGWLAHAGEEPYVRLAHAAVSQWLGSRMVIGPDELLVGRLELKAIVTWSFRGGVAFDGQLWQEEYAAANDAERARLTALRRAWGGRSSAALMDAVLLPSERALMGHQISSAPGCHGSPFHVRLAEEGVAGLRQRVAASRAAHAEDPQAEPDAWFDALEVILDGIELAAARYAQVARTEAARCADATRQRELLEIAARFERVPAQPATSFVDALQAYWFSMVLHGPDSPGRFDYDLGPWLERDLQAGAITLDAAQEWVDAIWLHMARNRCWSLTLSGQTPEGRDSTNTLTYLALDAMRRLRTDGPNVSLRVHRDTPRALVHDACELLASGYSMPALVNDEPVIAAMLARGIALEHARDYTLVGCTQVVPRGRCGGAYEDLVCNAAKCLELALIDVVDIMTGEQMGPRTGAPASLTSYEAFEAALWRQLDYMIETTTDVINRQYAVIAQHYPDLYKSLLVEGCLESGRDYRHGGPLYVEGLADVLGVTNVGDSLAVIKQLVYDEERLTLAQLADALAADWQGHEALRQECVHRVDKFGNDDAEADAYTQRVFDHILDGFGRREVLYGRRYGVDIIGWVGAVIWGQRTGATPDGRYRGAALCDSAGPSQGMDRRGATAALQSAARLPHDRAHGILALNLRFAGRTFAGADGRDKMVMLVDSAFGLGLQQLQINVVSSETLRAAQADPEAYASLVVRIGGYSTYFGWLSKEHQDDIIARTEHSL